MYDELKQISEQGWELIDELYNDLSVRILDKKNSIREDSEHPVLFIGSEGIGEFIEYHEQAEIQEDEDMNDEFHEAGFHIANSLDKTNDFELPLTDNQEDVPLDPNLLQKLPPSGIIMGPDHWLVLEYTLNNIASAISSRNPLQIVSLFSQAEEQCHFIDMESGIDIDEIIDTSRLIRVESGKLLYSPPKPQLIIPNLIIPVEKYLISLIKNNPESLFNISPREFEQLIAELFNDFGFYTELTQQTRDGGRDIIAIYEKANIRTKYLIECKRYKPKRKVSVAIVQRLFGVKISEAANKAILVTSSSFTKSATEFASNHIWDLDLKGYNDIIQWVNDYKNIKRPFI